jgi:uncharacterized protein YukE
MSGITLRMLWDTSADAIADRSAAWLGMAESLDNACEELIRGTRDLEHVWPTGPAAQAAHARAAQLRAAASNAHNPCRRIGRALREHADTVRSLQTVLRDISAEATARGYQVDITAGTVTAPQHLFQESSAPHVLAQTVNGYLHQLQGLADQATDLDRRTLTVIAANLPDARHGFGALSLPPVTEAGVRAQHGRSPADVHAWWQSLTPAQQEQAIADFPALLGRLDGVPAADRDTANRLDLAARRHGLQDTIHRHDAEITSLLADNGLMTPRLQELLADRHAAQDELDKLGHVDRALDKLGARGLLLAIDPSGDGKVIIAVGDPDTARHTGVWVPGLSTTLTSTEDNVDRMVSLHDAATRLNLDGGTVSTVYWLDYDAPDLDNFSVAGNDRSVAGAGPYVEFMQGMRATHIGADGHHLTAMGHSYGSTVVGEAALTGRLPVDDIITQGSPGTHAAHAGQLMADPRHVWAGSAGDDPVSDTRDVTRWVNGIPIVGPFISQAYEQGHGVSPHEERFGANQYRVDTSGHTHYWDPDSESLRNQAQILVGGYGLATLEHGESPEEVP